MTERVTVTVVFPQTFQFEFGDDENLSVEEKQERIKQHAEYLAETSPSDPIIHECSDPDLIE